MIQQRRVVITGQGAISALGHTADANINALENGLCGIGDLSFKNVDRLAIKIGGQIRDFNPVDVFSRSELGLFDPFTQFAMVAARQAVSQAEITFDSEDAFNAGVIMGTAGGGLGTQDSNFRIVYEEGKNRVHPFVVPRLMHNAAASQISMEFGLRGPSYCVSTACASSNHAMGQAFHAIRGGSADVMLTGGSESMLCFGGIKAWEGLRVLSPDGCRPFCASRNGMVQGEGAAVFVFEELSHAQSRGATILAEVIGFAMTSDAQDIVLPSQDGAAKTMELALRDAQIDPSDVGYINAHGTATKANDVCESAAISQVFRANSKSPLVSSTKSMHGHLIGATGAIELLACIHAVKNGVVAPTINHQSTDPDCAINLVANTAKSVKIDVAISNSFAFGGLNAVLALRKFK